jgi:hypothetical protein
MFQNCKTCLKIVKSTLPLPEKLHVITCCPNILGNLSHTFMYKVKHPYLHGKGFHKLKPENWMKFFHCIYMCFIHVFNSRHLCAKFINLWEIYFTRFSLLNCWMQSLWFLMICFQNKVKIDKFFILIFFLNLKNEGSSFKTK